MVPGGSTVKTIRNRTHTPIRVPLPRGKVLHLGPTQTGQIAHTDVEHEPLQRLVTEDVIEIVDEQTEAPASHEHEKGPHAETHGHQGPAGLPVRGDR